MKKQLAFIFFTIFFFSFQSADAQMSGTYSIGYGASDDYQILYQALQDLDATGANGSVIFELSSDYNPTPEAYPIYIHPFAGASVTNTLTIKPAAGTTHVIERDLLSAGTAIFAVIDGSHFILDGSNNGTSSRDLTVSSIGTDTQTGAIALYENVTAGTNITIKNCILKAGSKEFTTTGIFSNNFTNVLFENNKIYNAKIGIITLGNDVTILNNEIGSDITTEYLHYGISTQFGSEITISGNYIFNLIDDDATDAIRGITLNDLTGNVNVSENYIDNLIHTGTNVVQAIGVSDCLADNMMIYNNQISNIASDSYSDNYPAAIAINCPGMTTGMHILYNSINMPENNTYGTGTGEDGVFGGGINIGAGTGIILKNNIISNTLGKRVGGDNIVFGVAILINSLTTPFVENDNNIFFANNYSYNLLGNSLAGPMDLAAWQTWTGDAANSFFGEALYISDNDLNLQACSPAVAHAIDIPEITTDIDGNTRDTQYPTMGAYEYEKVQAGNLIQDFPVKDVGSVLLHWQYGSGCKSVTFMKEGNSISEPPLPNNGVTYISNTEFGLGSEIGTSGWFCVGNQLSENTEIITSVLEGQEYTVMVCEYFGNEGNEIYLTETSVNNPILVIGDNSGDVEDVFLHSINIHPNPTNGIITIEFDRQSLPNNQIKDINIVDIAGREIKTIHNITSENIEVDLSNYSKGVYFVKIESKGGIYSQKLILK